MTAFGKLSSNGIHLTHKNLKYIISKYNIKEISVFGSSIRNDFQSEWTYADASHPELPLMQSGMWMSVISRKPSENSMEEA